MFGRGPMLPGSERGYSGEDLFGLGQVPGIRVKTVDSTGFKAGQVRIVVQDENRAFIAEFKTDNNGELFVSLPAGKKVYLTPQVQTPNFVFKPANMLLTADMMGTTEAKFVLYPIAEVMPPPVPAAPPEPPPAAAPVMQTWMWVGLAAAAIGAIYYFTQGSSPHSRPKRRDPFHATRSARRRR